MGCGALTDLTGLQTTLDTQAVGDSAVVDATDIVLLVDQDVPGDILRHLDGNGAGSVAGHRDHIEAGAVEGELSGAVMVSINGDLCRVVQGVGGHGLVGAVVTVDVIGVDDGIKCEVDIAGTVLVLGLDIGRDSLTPFGLYVPAPIIVILAVGGQIQERFRYPRRCICRRHNRLHRCCQGY